MTSIVRTINKIPVAVILAFLFFCLTFLFFTHAHASALDNNLDENSSIYKYNALENKISLSDLSGNIVSNLQEDQPTADIELLDNSAESLQNILEKEKFSIKQIDSAMNALTNRSELKTLLVGNNLGILRFQLVQIEDMIPPLEALSAKTEDTTIKTQIDSQVTFLKEERAKVEEFILKQQHEFSLFGWFISII